MFARRLVPALLISLQCVTAQLLSNDISTDLTNNPENVQLEFCELANNLGYPCEQHKVTTEDGYILTMHHIPGDPEKPVFLQHGFLDSSITWILRGHDSLAAFLRNNTYDLWFGNTRGNVYSRAHTTLNPDKDEQFWDFSFHEMAQYDIPAMLDFVLDKTGQTKLQVIAHSQGTQVFFVLTILKPEYALKIKIVVCLAPIAYLKYAEKPLFLLASLAGQPLSLSSVLGLVGRGELLRNSSAVVTVFRTACTAELTGYAACGLALASALFGPDPAQLEPAFQREAFKYYPSSSSVKNLVHLAQIVTSNRFQQYDYGPLGNLRRYGSLRPPVYDLGKVRSNVSLYVGRNDRLSTVEDTNRLLAELDPAVKGGYYVMPYLLWNHIDFIWGLFSDIYLFEPVLNTLQDNY